MKSGLSSSDVKKRIACLVAGALLLALGAAANAQEEHIRLTPSEEAWLAAHPKIVVGTVPDWEPICMRNKSGDLSGMADSYKNLIELKLPITFNLAPETPWGTVLDNARDKKIDAVMLLGQTAARDKYLLFTDVLVDIPYVIITRADAAAVKGMESLAGKKVSVRSRFVSHEWIAANHPAIVLFPKETTEAALQAVLFGEVDAFAGSMAEVGEAIAHSSLTNLKVSANISFVNHLRIGVRNDWPELVSILNKAIADISPREHKAIWNLWVHLQQEGIDTRAVYALVGGFVFIIIAGSIIYLARLRKSYSKITQTEQKYSSLFQNMTEGFAHCKIITDVYGKPVDFIYLDINSAFERITGLKKENVVGRLVTEAIPGIAEAHPELFEIYGQVALTGNTARFEIEFKPLSLWLSISVYSPKKEFFVATFQDITERKKAETELKRVNRMLTMLSHCNQLLVKEVDEETLLNSICRIILDTGGYALAQVAERGLGASTAGIVPRVTEFRLPVVAMFLTPEVMADCPCNKAMLNNETVIIRNIAQCTESEWCNAALRNGCNTIIALPLRFSASVDAVLSIYAEDAGSFSESEVELLKELADDISLGVRTIRSGMEKEVAERRVRESELRFRSLAQTASDAIISIDSGGEVTFWNDGATKMFGYAEDEIIGRDVTLIMPERYHTLHRAGLARVAAGGAQRVIGTTATLEGVRIGGAEFPLELSLATWEMDREKYFTAIIRDVTDRKMAEDALRESNYNLRKVMEDSPVPLALTDEEQRIVFLNKKFIRIFGYDLTDIPTVEEWWPRAYPDPSLRDAIKAEWNRRVRAVIREGVEFVPMEAVVTCKDGNRREIVFNFSFIGHRGLTIFHDVTERKTMDEKLRMSEKSLADAQTLAHLGNWEMDIQTGKTIWSDELRRIYGLAPEEVEPTFDRFMALVRPEDRKTIEESLHKVRSGGSPQTEFEMRIIRPDGQERNIFGRLEVVTGKDGRPAKLRGINLDITERKIYERKLEIANDELKAALEQVRQTQAVLMRSEKLAAVGTLSAGVAHEILNPLNIISTICQLLLLDERRGKVYESLNEIILQIQRAAKITNSLRMFAREHKMDIAPVDLQQLFEHTAKLMERDLNLDNIFVDRQYDANAPLIMADADQLAQVFMNLLTNARDVLQPRRGGMITVTTKGAENGVKFIFHDNGPGMPEDVVDRIFDPFFTTKEPGKGTGLGLSVVHRIIEDHGGTIAVETKEGEGTCFTIFLPKEAGPLIRKKGTDKI